MEIDCPDCKGTGVIDPCPRCTGEGRIDHECWKSSSLELIIDIYGCNRRGMLGRSSESLGIYRCKKCNQLLKVRFQYDPGSGSDDIWMWPGETSRHYSFPVDEAKIVARILNATSVADLPEGLVHSSGYIREFAERRVDELAALQDK